MMMNGFRRTVQMLRLSQCQGGKQEQTCTQNSRGCLRYKMHRRNHCPA